MVRLAMPAAAAIESTVERSKPLARNTSNARSSNSSCRRCACSREGLPGLERRPAGVPVIWARLDGTGPRPHSSSNETHQVLFIERMLVTTAIDEVLALRTARDPYDMPPDE